MTAIDTTLIQRVVDLTTGDAAQLAGMVAGSFALPGRTLTREDFERLLSEVEAVAS